MIRTAENCVQALLARNGFSGSKIVKHFFIKKKKKVFVKSEYKATTVGVCFYRRKQINHSIPL